MLSINGVSLNVQRLGDLCNLECLCMWESSFLKQMLR